MKVKETANGKWRIDYYYRGRRIRETYPNKTLAEIAASKRKVEIAEGKFLDKKREVKITFKDFAKSYLETHSIPNKKSYRRDEGIISYFNSIWGNKNINSIFPLDVEEFKRRRIKDVSLSTCNRELACIKNLFSKAIEWGKLKDNPAKTVKLFKVKNQRLRYLEKEEIKRLIDACPDYLKNIVSIAVLTGMRKSEILNMKWRDVNFNQRIITLLDTKNGEKREVPMNGIVYDLLMHLSLGKAASSPYVFPNRDGKAYQEIKRSFGKALIKANIKDFCFHSLRHTWASQMAMAGVPLEVIQKLGGWKSFSMVLRYAHLSPSYQKGWVDHFASHMDTLWTPTPKEENAATPETLDTLRAHDRTRTDDPRITNALLCR